MWTFRSCIAGVVIGISHWVASYNIEGLVPTTVYYPDSLCRNDDTLVEWSLYCFNSSTGVMRLPTSGASCLFFFQNGALQLNLAGTSFHIILWIISQWDLPTCWVCNILLVIQRFAHWPLNQWWDGERQLFPDQRLHNMLKDTLFPSLCSGKFNIYFFVCGNCLSYLVHIVYKMTNCLK